MRNLVVGILALWLLGGSAQDQVDLIVYNATIVTMDGAGRVLPRGAVAIRGRDIVAVEPQVVDLMHRR